MPETFSGQVGQCSNCGGAIMQDKRGNITTQHANGCK